MRKSACIYWADTKGIQVSELSDSGFRLTFGRIDIETGLSGDIVSLIGYNGLGRYGTGENEEAISIIGIWDAYGRLGNVS